MALIIAADLLWDAGKLASQLALSFRGILPKVYCANNTNLCGLPK